MSKKSFYINAAGFILKLSFEYPHSNIHYQLFLKDLKTVWGKLLQDHSKQYDLQITFVGERDKLNMIKSKDRNVVYHMIYKKVPREKNVLILEPISMYQFNILVKEILIDLVKRDGFVLHASGSIDKNGVISLFLTRSGGGKSTTRSLYMTGSGDSFFCDDSVIVRYINGEWLFFSPPFIEKEFLPTKLMARKAFLYFVTKAKNPSVSKIVYSTTAVKKMLKNIWVSDNGFDIKILRKIDMFTKVNNLYKLNNSLDYKMLTKVIKTSSRKVA